MGKLAILERARLMGKLEHNTKHPGLGCFLSYFSQFALTQLRLHTGLVLLVGPSSMMQSCKHLRSSLVQFFCGIVCGTKLRQIVFFFSSLSLVQNPIANRKNGGQSADTRKKSFNMYYHHPIKLSRIKLPFFIRSLTNFP